MPRIQSAQKALRQNVRRRARNLERQKRLRTTVKRLEKLVTEGKKEEAANYLATAHKVIDKLAKANFLPTNKARRIKSRLAHQLAAMK